MGGIERGGLVGGLPDVLIVQGIEHEFAVGICDLDPLRPHVILKTVFGLWVELIDLDPKLWPSGDGVIR